MTTIDIAYDVDGATMIGRLALPDGEGLRPGVLIAHEGNGLDDYQKRRADVRRPRLRGVRARLPRRRNATRVRDEINARLTRSWRTPTGRGGWRPPGSTSC